MPRQQWQSAADAARSQSQSKATGVDFAQINDYLVKYQDPRQADAIMKVQQELDETKIVLVRLSASVTCADGAQHKTIESVLERGEKLDSLVEKSNALSTQCSSSIALGIANDAPRKCSTRVPVRERSWASPG